MQAPDRRTSSVRVTFVNTSAPACGRHKAGFRGRYEAWTVVVGCASGDRTKATQDAHKVCPTRRPVLLRLLPHAAADCDSAALLCCDVGSTIVRYSGQAFAGLNLAQCTGARGRPHSRKLGCRLVSLVVMNPSHTRTTRWTPRASWIAVVAVAGSQGAVVLSSSAQPIVGRGDATGGCPLPGAGAGAGPPAAAFVCSFSVLTAQRKRVSGLGGRQMKCVMS